MQLNNWKIQTNWFELYQSGKNNFFLTYFPANLNYIASFCYNAISILKIHLDFKDTQMIIN